MTLDRAYADARQLIDLDADYTVHVRAGNGWQPPGNRDQRELPGLDVLLAARRVLCAQPAGRVWSTRPDTLNVCTGDGLLWLRFTVTTLAETGLCDAAECAEFLTDSGHCPRCAADPSPGPGGPRRCERCSARPTPPSCPSHETTSPRRTWCSGPRLPHPRPAAPCPPRPHAAAAGGKAAPSAPGTHA